VLSIRILACHAGKRQRRALLWGVAERLWYNRGFRYPHPKFIFLRVGEPMQQATVRWVLAP
jgi:hypothetical protein